MRKSDFTSVDEEQRFPIDVESQPGQRYTVLVQMSAKISRESLGSVLFDKDGLAYMPKTAGSRLLHDRAPQYDLDKSETVTVKVTEPVESYFPVLVYAQGDLGEPIGQAQVRYLSYQAGEARLLTDADDNTYAARPDGKPGVIALD